MTKSKQLIAIAATVLMSASALADFNYDGKLEITYLSGQSVEKDLPLAYTKNGYNHIFQVGEKKFNVPGEPQSYSFAMLLQPNNLVWIQEFDKGEFKSFNLELGKYKLKLVKTILNEPVKGDYIFSVNNVDYFFKQNLAQVTMLFGSEGIEEITVDGMVASLGLNTAKNACEEMEEGSEERAACDETNKEEK